MAAGHDEYWTKTMRDAWEAARDAGVNLAFMGANDSYWQVGYEDGGRTLVGYKASPDPDPEPGQKTTQFRQMSPARPECGCSECSSKTMSCTTVTSTWWRIQRCQGTPGLRAPA
ncbi:MAG: hypothetical protein JO153_04975 [Solirubrobacterales bacterium]|nr:hypothetical protein [Solirubrobacterales bacterium]